MHSERPIDSCAGNTQGVDHQLNRVIALLYDAASDKDKWPDFLEALAVCFNAPVGHFINIDPTLTHLNFSLLYGADERLAKLYGRPGDTSMLPVMRRYEDHLVSLMPSDPRIAFSHSHPNRAFSCREVLVTDEIHNSAMYREHLQHTNIEYSLLVSVPGDNNRQIGAGLFRGREEQAFTKREVERFGLLVPHLRRAVVIQTRFAIYNAERMMGLEALDSFPIGILILDEQVHVRHTNRAAQDLLIENDGLGLFGNKPIFKDTRLVHKVFDYVRTSANGFRAKNPPPGTAFTVKRKADRSPLQGLMTPLWGNYLRYEPHGSAEPLVILYLTDPEVPQETPVEHIQRLFGLTAAEAKVVERLVAGETVATIAAELDIKEDTVRGHLKSAYAKTGVKGQADLVRLVLSSPLASFAGK